MSNKNEDQKRLSVLFKIASGKSAVLDKPGAREVLAYIDELKQQIEQWRGYAKHPDSMMSKYEEAQAAAIRSRDSTHNYNRHLEKMLKESEATIKELKQEISTLRSK